MANAGELSFRSVGDCDLTIIAPNDPAAMVQYAEECRTLGIPYIFDPGQQCARMSGDELTDGVLGATVVICNDYEFELLGQKTGMREADVLALLARGYTNREIASTLVISVKTAGVHVSHILRKLDAPNRLEAAAIAHRLAPPRP